MQAQQRFWSLRRLSVPKTWHEIETMHLSWRMVVTMLCSSSYLALITRKYNT